jgi:hypothetical protein
MRILGAVVEVSAGPMPDIGQEITVHHAVAPQTVGDDLARLVLHAGQKPLEKPPGGHGVPAVLDENVEHDAVLVQRAPKVVQDAIDPQVHLIEVSGVARLRPASAQLPGELGAEVLAPLPEALVCDGDAPLGQDELDVPQAEAEQVVELDGVADDLGREAVAGVGDGSGHHLTSLAGPHHSG